MNENRNTAIVAERDALVGQEIVSQDGAAGALAQAMIAQVQARYVMALKRPRNMDQVRQDLLRECERPSFAKAAWYRKPIGQGVEGLSIRFVEAALRIMHNCYADAIPVSNDDEKQVFLVVVTDLETNTTYTEPVTVTKTVEKKKPDEGTKILGKRKNSYGDWTYLVPATDDEILNKLGALKSKAIRTAGLRIIPGDLIDECKALIMATRRNDAARDPDAERKELVDLFETIRVPAAGLAEWIGGDLGTASPMQLVELRAVFQAIREGEATWADCLAASSYRAAPTEGAPNPKIVSLREKLAARTRGPKKGETDPAILAKLRDGIAAARTLDELKPGAEELKSIGKTGKGLSKADYDAIKAELKVKHDTLASAPEERSSRPDITPAAKSVTPLDENDRADIE